MTSMINDDDSPSAKQVKAARALLAWTQADLARAANVAVSTIADFERGQRTPVANNAQAIKDALEAKCVKFLDGGVVTVATVSSPVVPGPGKPLRWIEAQHLSQWGATRDGQAKLPELVSRLIFAAYGGAARMRFPSDDSVQHAGWDGVCSVAIGSAYVPAGKSVWEIGGQRSKISAKADEDYAKRSAKPLGEIVSETTYVCVTPQRWPGKDQWAADKRAEGIWKNVQVVDGDMLVHWLEQCPGIAEWLASHIGRRLPGLRNLREIWDEWSLATVPALTSGLLITDRDEQATAVLKWLYGPPSVLSVQAEAVGEAMAFLWAVVEPLPEPNRLFWESRFLVPQSDQVARDLIGLGPKLVVILNQGDPGLARKLAEEGHHVYVAFGSEVGLPRNVLSLPRPWRYNVERSLGDMGLDLQKAHALASACGRSLTVLRRLMPASPIKRPGWAERPVSPALLIAMLAGAWRDDNPVDKKILETLGGMSYDALEAELAPLAAAMDGPVRRSGSVWKLASLRDAWFLLAANLTTRHIDLLTNCFLNVLGDPDPAFDAGPDARWTFDRQPPTRASEELRRGLSEALIALGVYPEESKAVSDAGGRSSRAVRNLLADADERRWWSLSDDFKRLAEAAPDAFLDAIDTGLDKVPTPLASLFRSDEGFLHNREYLSDLLWALEMLCWSPAHLGRVSQLLARLADMDPGGSFSNRPADTLRRIFLPWVPQTFATAAQRLIVIDLILNRFDRVGWELLMAVAPTGHAVSSPSATPLWRDFSGDPPESVTRPSLAKAYDAIGERLIEAAGSDPARWISLLKHWANFGPSWRGKAAERLASESMRFNESARFTFREELRGLINKHESFSDAAWAMDEQALRPLRDLFDALEPKDIAARYSWLFGSKNRGIPRGSSWQEAEEQQRAEQRAAAEAILQATPPDQVISFSQTVERPDELGYATATCTASEILKDALLDQGLSSDDDKIGRFAAGMLSGLLRERGEVWLLQRFDEVVRAQGNFTAALRLAFALPSRRENWDRIAAASVALDQAYWSQLSLYAIRDSEDPRFVCAKLLAVGRGQIALAWIAAHESMTVDTDLILDVLNDQSTIRPDGSAIDSTMLSYHVGLVFQRLDKDLAFPENEMVRLEWAYYQALEQSERPPRTLHKALAKNPEFFISLLKTMYRPSEGVEEELTDAEGAEAVASQAYRVLSDWTYVPGSGVDGAIDGAELEKWVKEVRRLAAEAHRAEIGDEKIGEILSAARRVDGEPWPPEPVRDVIEIVRSRHLEDGFRIGVYNRRGVTTRLPTDGGDQERDLAAKYRADAKEIALAWPRTSAVLARIADSYERDAEHEDQEAEQRDW